jgi:hypothetical protein
MFVLMLLHSGLVIALFLCFEASRDGEAVMGWVVMDVADFPLSLLADAANSWLWRNHLLWYSEHSAIRKFAWRAGVDHLNVGAALLYTVAGTVQWGAVGFLIQSLWRRHRRTRANQYAC